MRRKNHLNKASLLGIALLLAGLATMAAPAMAQERSDAGQDVLKFLGKSAQNAGLTSDPESDTDINVIIIAIINTILALTGVIFFIQMFYAGFRWMTARGNEEQIKESKQTIKSSIIGIIITLSAFIISNFVFNQLAKISSPAAAPPAQEAPK